MAHREPLDKIEARILGVLIEKELTTPDGYPLSLNALQNGCNQKSNRDPQLSLDTQSLEEALNRLRLNRLVREVHEAGARVLKYAHDAKPALEVDTQELAVLAELLMRGPQTVGELRGRVERMTPVPTLDDLQRVLKPLMERGMVVVIAPAPGSRAPRYLQTIAPGIHPGIDAGTAPRTAPAPAAPNAPAPAGPTHTVHVAGTQPTTHGAGPTPLAPTPAASPSGASADARLSARIEKLEHTVARLEQELRDLRERVE
ncbi:MAG: DUF480 domain-containing protein [Planctomycetes bacterium]|nr:DUF480 domain-containing protein [Planctomycetota bacterium]